MAESIHKKLERVRKPRVHITYEVETEGAMRFRIEALMYADPAPETIVLDSFVDPAARGIKVGDDTGG